MVKQLLTKFALLAVMLVGVGSAWADTVTDVLNREFTGISNGGGYGSWDDKTSNSDAVYAGQSAGGNDAIQLRSNNSNSGVVTTTSGGKVRKITVTWGSQTTSGRTLNVYGKNTAYSKADELYNSTNQGTLLGTIVNGTSTELSVSGDYEYIGFRSNSGALYLSNVEIVWEVSGSGSGLTASDLAITGAPVALSFDLYNNSAAQTVSYTTSGTGAITVSGGDGYVTTSVNESAKTITVTPIAVTPSEQTITISQAADNTYNAGSATFSITVANSDPNAPGTENNPYTVAQAIENTPSSGTSGNVYIKGIVSSFYNTSITGDGTNYRYYISDNGTTNTQLLVYKGKKSETESFSDDNDLLIGDEVVIYGQLTTYQEAPEINQGNYIVSLIRKSNPGLSFGTTTEFTCDLFGAFTAPTLTFASGYDGTISYESSDENVAEVANDGTVTIKAAGTTTITATGAATSTFNNGSASYTLTVTENEDQSAVTPSLASGKYVKVTSTADITDGHYLIVYEEGSVAFNGGLTTLDAVENTIDVTINNNEIAATTTTQAAEFTLDATNGTLLSASGYYIGQTSDANGMATNETNTYENTITFDSGNADIVSGGAYLRYNSASNQLRFRYYKSSSYTNQKAIQLYKYVAGTPSDTKEITLSSYGYKTLVASKNFTVSGATAYIVTAATGSGITTASLNVVPANEPVFLKGEANATATLTFTEDAADDASANKLAISAASTNYDGDYVLASKNGAVGFYKWNGGTLGAGRVYLPAANVTDNAARSFLPFASDEATGIASAKVSQSTEQVYDLQGRRVAQPTKGLYIVNGKKMILK